MRCCGVMTNIGVLGGVFLWYDTHIAFVVDVGNDGMLFSLVECEDFMYIGYSTPQF